MYNYLNNISVLSKKNLLNFFLYSSFKAIRAARMFYTTKMTKIPCFMKNSISPFLWKGHKKALIEAKLNICRPVQKINLLINFFLTKINDVSNLFYHLRWSYMHNYHTSRFFAAKKKYSSYYFKYCVA